MGLVGKFTQGAAADTSATQRADAALAAARAESYRAAGPRFEYKAETLRSKLIGDKMDGGQVEQLLNDRAAEGWQMKSITETEVKGRVGPGGTMGLLVVFERPVSPSP